MRLMIFGLAGLLSAFSGWAAYASYNHRLIEKPQEKKVSLREGSQPGAMRGFFYAYYFTDRRTPGGGGFRAGK